MYVVLGAAGNVGRSIVEALRHTGERIVAVVHSAAKAEAIAGGRVEAAVVDVGDADALRAVLRTGRRAFLLNPPGDPSGDSNAAELRTAHSIAAALSGSGLHKLVLQSTYGARPGNAIGDLSVLYELERLVRGSGIPAAINRGAYYFTNLDMLLEPARQGMLPTAFPAAFELPMVSPRDLGIAAAARLASDVADVGIQYVEGPRRYSFADVADAFQQVLGRPVSVATTPRDGWEQNFRDVGLSAESARSFARMTAATLDDPELPADPKRGKVTLEQHIAGLAGRQSGPPLR